MSLPTQADLISFGFGFGGEPATWLAPSSSYVEQSLGWGFQGEIFNAPAPGSTPPAPVIPILAGKPALFIAM